MSCCPIPETGTPPYRLFDWLSYRAPGHSHGIGDYPDEATFFGAWKRFGGSTPSYCELLRWEKEESEDSEDFDTERGTDTATDATNPITKRIKRHRRFGLDTPSPSPSPPPVHVPEYQRLREEHKNSLILPRHEVPSVTIVFLEEDGQMKEWIMLPRLTRSARQKSEGRLVNCFWALESASRSLKVKFGENQLKSKVWKLPYLEVVKLPEKANQTEQVRPSGQCSKSPSSHDKAPNKPLRSGKGGARGIRKKTSKTRGRPKTGRIQ